MTHPTFGPYEVLEKVASGATGTVYRARQTELGRIVAIKELNAAMCGFPGLLERFRGEAQMLAGLDHEHIVAVYDYIEDGNRAWIVEEWVEGAALDEILSAQGTLTPQQAVGSLRGALLGLAYAHERGLVHRDIAPNNIVADLAGTSKLLDFGLAAPVGTVGVCGTPAYVSPEAATGTAMGKSSDVYSAGAVLYTLLDGHPPYPASNPVAAMRAHMDEPVPSLHGHGHDFAAVVRHAMAKDPSARPGDAAALLAELEDAAEKRFGAGWLAGASIAGAVGATVAARSGGGASTPTPTAADTVVVTSAAVNTGRAASTQKITEAAAASHVEPSSPAPRRARRFNGRNVAIAGGVAAVVAASAIGVAVASGGGGGSEDTSATSAEPTATATPTTSASPSAAPPAAVIDAPRGEFAFIVRLVKSTNPLQPAGTVLQGVWTFTAKCADEKCTGHITSSGGAAYTYTYDGKRLVARGTRDSACLDYSTGQPVPGTDGTYHEVIVTKLTVAKRAKAEDGHLGAPLVLKGTQTQVQRNVRPVANCGTQTTRQERTVKATFAGR